MSEPHRTAWSGREDAVWWPGGITSADQQTLHHQHILNQHHQQQLAAAQAQQLQQQQQQQVASHSTTASSVGSQQLFSYKMASSFQNPATTSASSNVYDYRLGMVSRPGDAPAAQWWYPGAVDAAMQQQNMHNVQSSSPTDQQQSQQHQPNQQSQSQQQNELQQQKHNQQQQLQLHNQIQQVQQINVSKKSPRGKVNSKPRGRMTAYAFFVQTCREEHKKKHPDENVIFAEFSKKCAERWKTMIDKERKRFHEMAEKDKQRYDLEMQNYVPPKGEKVGRGKKRKQIKDPNAPKRSLSAFFWFSNDERSKVKAINPEYGVGDIAKELGRRWSDCDPETKSKYEAMAEKDKARYDKEMTAYKKRPKVPDPPEEEPDYEDEADEEDDE